MELCIVDCVEITARVVSTSCALRTRTKAMIDGVLVVELINMSLYPRTLACEFHLRRVSVAELIGQVSLRHPVVRLV